MRGNTRLGRAGGFQILFGAAVLLALVAAVVLVKPTSGTEAAEPAPTPTSAPTTAPTTTAEPTTTSTTTTAPPVIFPVEPVDDHNAENDMYGWGTAQPTAMRATVQYGGTNTLMPRETRQLLAEQLVQVRAAALKVGTVAEAERLGYVKNFQRINGRGFEYVNWGYWSDHLDISKPTVLAFEGDQPDSRVVSVAYNVLSEVQDGPPTDFPLDYVPWHFHSNLCEKDNTIVGSVEYDPDGVPYPDQVAYCVNQGAKFRPDLNHWMVDFWVIPGWENPWGLVSSKHPDLMFEPTPWFTGERTGEQDGLGMYCKIPDGQDPADGTTRS